MRKGMAVCIVALFMVIVTGSIINAQVVKMPVNVSVKNILKSDASYMVSDTVDVMVRYCNPDGNIEKNIIKLSAEEASNLAEQLKNSYESGKSFEEICKYQLILLKENGIIPLDVSMDEILKWSDKKPSEKTMFTEAVRRLPSWSTVDLVDAMCVLSFAGGGVGTVFGTHSAVQFMGVDAVGVFGGLFFVASMSEGGLQFAGPDVFLGFILGFMGFLIFMPVPPVYGPFIFGLGIAVSTQWIGLTP
jgi:hypothetical protein